MLALGLHQQRVQDRVVIVIFRQACSVVADGTCEMSWVGHSDQALIAWRTYVMTSLAQEFQEQVRRDVVVEIELHDLRIRAISSGASSLNFPPFLESGSFIPVASMSR